MTVFRHPMWPLKNPADCTCSLSHTQGCPIHGIPRYLLDIERTKKRLKLAEGNETTEQKLARFEIEYGFKAKEIEMAQWLLAELRASRWAIKAFDAFPGGGDNLTVTAYFVDGQVMDFEIRDDTE